MCATIITSTKNIRWHIAAEGPIGQQKTALPWVTVRRRPLSINPLASLTDEVQVAAAWQHVEAKITAAVVELSPFALIRVDNVFPADFYKLIVGQLPDNSAYDFSIAEDYAVIGNEARRGALRLDVPANVSQLSAPSQGLASHNG